MRKVDLQAAEAEEDALLSAAGIHPPDGVVLPSHDHSSPRKASAASPRSSSRSRSNSGARVGFSALGSWPLFDNIFSVHDQAERAHFGTSWLKCHCYYVAPPLTEIRDYFGVRMRLLQLGTSATDAPKVTFASACCCSAPRPCSAQTRQEKTAIYFAFAYHYTTWLMYIALPSVAGLILQISPRSGRTRP